MQTPVPTPPKDQTCSFIRKTREQIPAWVVFCNAEGKIEEE